MRDNGLEGFYHLRKAQVHYNIDFITENRGLRAENTYSGNDNPYILIR
jgi:hypothetical protein